MCTVCAIIQNCRSLAESNLFLFSSKSNSGFLPKSISDIVTNVLKQVQHDVDGPPAVTLYRVLFAYYMTYNGHDSLRGKEVEKLVGYAVIDLLRNFSR